MSDPSSMKIALAFATPFAVAVAFHPLFQVKRKQRALLLIAVVAAIAFLPLLIPKEMGATRFFAALAALIAAVKMFDVHQQREATPPFKEWVAYVANPSAAVLRRLDAEPMFTPRKNVLRIAAGLALAIFGWGALYLLFQVDYTPIPFVVEHVAKAVAFFVGLHGFTGMNAAVLRLFGVKVRDILDNAFIAVTPADFWRRYNRVIGQTLHENVFKRSGGFRHPIRATLLTFFASAVMHEYISIVILEKFQGYQLTFFMVQGLGVAATMRLKPTGWRAVACIALTLAFNLTTGVLFIATADQIIPWWSHRPFPYW